MSEERKLWGIHAQDDCLFLNEDLVALGWKEMGDMSALAPEREAFRKRFVARYPEAKKGSVSASVGMLYRFVHEMQIGDYVIFPSKSDRMVNIGLVEGDYHYAAAAPRYRQQRRVKWLKHLPRTSFSQGALYEIGTFMSLFSVKNYAEEFLDALDKGFAKGRQAEDESVGVTAEGIIENTKDFILKEISRQLKGHGMEDFVADLLRAMGYRTVVSPQGGDGGIDITAYKDELPPRILVQVKSQGRDVSESTLQSLKGAMREGDYGLFVTLSNYTKNARRYIDNTPIIRGINGAELVELVLAHYEQLSENYRRMIPLKMVYIPVTREGEGNRRISPP